MVMNLTKSYIEKAKNAVKSTTEKVSKIKSENFDEQKKTIK